MNETGLHLNVLVLCRVGLFALRAGYIIMNRTGRNYMLVNGAVFTPENSRVDR